MRWFDLIPQREVWPAMDVPEGLISRLCHLLAFLPFFLLLLLLAVVKGWIFSPLPSFSFSLSCRLLVFSIFFSGFHRADRVRHCLGREHRLDPRAVPVACRLDLLLYREVRDLIPLIVFLLLLLSIPFCCDFNLR